MRWIVALPFILALCAACQGPSATSESTPALLPATQSATPSPLTGATDANGSFAATVRGSEETFGDAFADVVTGEGQLSLPLK